MKGENYSNTISNFKTCVHDLKDKMQKVLRMCDSTDFKQNEAFDTLQDGLINILDIKSFNSTIQKEIEIFKEITTKEKESVEDKNLNFQNYLYQKENIISNIHACINYPTSELNKINIPNNKNVIEYFRDKGVNYSEEELKMGDKLEYELELRKKLDNKLKILLNEKENNNSVLKEKEKFFKELPNYFTNFESNTLKAQNFLNLKITEKNENTFLSEKLPSPLYVIYNSLLCLDNKNIKFDVRISGKSELVEEYNKNYPLQNINFNPEVTDDISVNKEEGEHSDDGEINEEMSVTSDKNIDLNITHQQQSQAHVLHKLKLRRKNKLKNNKKWNWNSINFEDQFLNNQKKINKFPLHVEFNINKISSDSNTDLEMHEDKFQSISIKFYYIPIFNIVTTEVNSKNKLINTNSLLSNIFMPPTNLLSNLRNKIDSAINCLCDEFSSNEIFFDYVQILSNNSNYKLSFLKKLSNLVVNKKKPLTAIIDKDEVYLDNPDSITMDNFINKIINRINFLPSLFQQVSYISKNNKISADILSEINSEARFKIREKTKLIECVQILQSDYLHIYSDKYNNADGIGSKVISIFETNSEGNYVKRYVKVPCSIYNEDEALYYKFVFERKSIRVNAYAEIGFDYPLNNPKFILTLDITTTDTPNIPPNLQSLISEENKDFYLKYPDTDSQSELEDALADIGSEVNFYFFEFCPENNMRNLLSYQIRNIQLCFDILFDLEGGKESILFPKPTKGSKKRRPFSFNMLKNIFEAR